MNTSARYAHQNPLVRTHPQQPSHLPSHQHLCQVQNTLQTYALTQTVLLPYDIRAKFTSLLDEYDHVFDPNIKGYNAAKSPFKARVNMGPVEPTQRKGCLPQYACHQLVELQQKFVELEALGVFRRPEDINVTVQHLNPSFLVIKPSGGSRLVTAFGATTFRNAR